MAVVGPSGKDLYPCVVTYMSGMTVQPYPFLVEAISHDEAIGLAHRIGQKLKPKVAHNMFVKVGLSQCVTPEQANIHDSP